MNSAEEISKFREPNHTVDYYSPTLNRRLAGYGYELPDDRSPKKEKKWSIGSLFRRKKKGESDSTSDDESQKPKGFLSRKKRKSSVDKKKKNKTMGTFDHVVIPRNHAKQSEDRGILSDPSETFRDYHRVTQPVVATKKVTDDEINSSKLSVGSADSSKKSGRKGLTKVRAEARRLNAKGSSSDEDSVSSSRFKSDESLTGLQRDGSLGNSRRSRAARTERYLKRHSRDGENPKDYLRLSKSDAEHWRTSDDSNRSPSRSPLVPKLSTPTHIKHSYSSLSSQSGLSTIPPSHGSHRVSNSTSNPSYKPPLSMNEYNQATTRKLPDTRRSLSCEANIHKDESQFPIIGRQHRMMMMIRQPPPPPPRDPRSRLVTAQYYENGRPNTYYFDGQGRSKSFNLQTIYPVQARRAQTNMLGCRSTSEDHLPKTKIQLVPPRPSSATPIARKGHSNADSYNYLTDKKPRSRKPIFIQPTADKSETRKVLDFWRKKDQEVVVRPKTPPKSPQMFTSETRVQTQVFLPSVVQFVEPPKPFNDNNNDSMDEEMKRKSTNLEEALDELEAIYNSLRLGDEDLLERAEQRERDAAARQFEAHPDKYPNWNPSRGAMSDSSFSYEPFDSSPRRKRLLKKSQTVDRRTDDMAFRKMNKERSATINDPQSVLSSLSYLQASPVYYAKDQVDRGSTDPDITLDDVVYRNVKYANSSPKVLEPQPPFGIPVGPITPAANSDYLHAVPDNVVRPAFKPRRIPDLVKDDLAFRNLRKDSTKEPALPPLSPDDVKNNNVTPFESKLDLNSLKKKRAVRSLSANIGSLINKDVVARGLQRRLDNDSDGGKTLTDIADAMQEARQVLKEQDDKINATNRAFLSDTDNNSVAECRMNFLNSLKAPFLESSDSQSRKKYLHAKPPRGLTPDRTKSPRSPKESTPIPVSPLEDKDSSLDDLLTALANEARETTERITNELKNFDKVEDKLKKLSDIDAVSEQAKLCERLLGSPTTKESLHVESDHDYENLKSGDDEDKVQKCTSPFEDRKAELIASFQELTTDEAAAHSEEAGKHSPQSPPTTTRRSRSRLPRWLRPNSCGNFSYQQHRLQATSVGKEKERPRRSSSIAMSSEGGGAEAGRAERVARYKEERRRQLAAQFQALQQPAAAGTGTGGARRPRDSNSSSSEGAPVRSTRASRLRAAAQDNSGSPSPTYSPRISANVEKIHQVASAESSSGGVGRIERDKSSKRKSNLNRALNSEEVPCLDGDADSKARRRRRRFFPQDLLDQQVVTKESNDKPTTATSKTTTNLSASSSQSHITASSSTSRSPGGTARKTDLAMHMENARKGIPTSYSEMGRKVPQKRDSFPSATSNNNNSINNNNNSNNSSSFSKDVSFKTKKSGLLQQGDKVKSSSDNEVTRNSRSIAKKMEELTALTKETLARVERLASGSNSNNSSTRESPRAGRPSSGSPLKSDSGTSSRNPHHSILKKKSLAEEKFSPRVEVPAVCATPVSILKRKVSQDEPGGSTHTPPVTFSPSVVEPATTNRRQGILKKRRSLDESQVLRHRSCSPSDAVSPSPGNSILKSQQRRSSLEDLTQRIDSPEGHLHGILKRKSSRSEEEDHSLNSPQSILKRRSGASSAGSTTTPQTPHVSITTAVILAAARGAEMVLESPETVRPILKKKSFSDEHPYNSESSSADVPRPILKKKSSTDTDDCEQERPKRPILKMTRNSPSLDVIENDNNCDSSSSSVRPILKSTNDPAPAGRPRLSFSGDRKCDDYDDVRARSNSRRAHTICSTEFSVSSALVVPSFKGDRGAAVGSGEDDRDLRRPRPLSVSELVMNFESTKSPSTGAVPKKSSMKRHSDRYRTQPVTSNELEASLNFVRSPQLDKSPLASPTKTSVSSLLDFTTSLDNDRDLNSYFSFHKSPDSGVKMSSDSAFQSLGDGLELEEGVDEKVEEVARVAPSSPRAVGKLEPKRLELQMKAIADEAKNMRLGKGGLGMKYRARQPFASSTERSSGSRYSTQPVTFDEVQEASKMGKPSSKNSDDSEEMDDASDPANLSLCERIKLFDFKLKLNELMAKSPQLGKVQRQEQEQGVTDKCPSVTARRRPDRFQTQPVTWDEVETARFKPAAGSRVSYLEDDIDPSATGAANPTRRGILKSTAGLPPRIMADDLPGRRTDDEKTTADLPDVTHDEGISCNDSASDSETVPVTTSAAPIDPPLMIARDDRFVTRRRREEAGGSAGKFNKSSSDSGDSSGGREVRNIFRNENKLKVKQALESVLSKSRSQGTVGDDSGAHSPPLHHHVRNARGGATVRRSLTQSSATGMPRTIAEIQERLQQSGASDWRRRVPQNNNSNDEIQLLKDKNKYNDELSEKSILAAKKDELDASSKQWRSRVEKSDAEKFSVAGKMEKARESGGHNLQVKIPAVDKTKNVPQAKRFKGKGEADSSSTPVSPDKKDVYLTRSFSVPDPTAHSQESRGSPVKHISGQTVTIARPDDFTFTNFYKSVSEVSTKSTDVVEVSVDSFDAVTRQSLLVQKKNVQVQKRRGASRNPIKALASRSDISNEYTEVITGVAEREKKRLNIEKLAKSSNLAVEALAGLASSEDFTTVSLKKSTTPSLMVPFKDIMLLQVKGRRSVQTRLVEPIAASINEGDCFVLVTSVVVFTYIGAFSNVIEQSRCADIVNHIQQTGDLGCKDVQAVTIDSRDPASKQAKGNEKFWKIVGGGEEREFTGGGHPDEDEIYEANILTTNIIYGVENDELVPMEQYCGAAPKFDMLKPDKVFVFDFGCELYVWSGKTASLTKKKTALKLAKDLWEDGYNYSDYNVCPFNVARLLGDRDGDFKAAVKSTSRPDWALFAKITQHRETILFKEKFLDWPDFTRVIRVKGDSESDKFVDPSYNIPPCDVKEMLRASERPDLVVEGHHLGRGNEYFDEATNRLFEFDTLDIKVWRILENQSEKLEDKSVGHFYDCDSYIVRWNYRMTVRGRELSGKPSKHIQSGRDRTIYFCWQGANASINEKGLAALLTVELDSEKAPQIRVAQGSEPAAFLRLFKGSMVVHMGKRGGEPSNNNDLPRLFMVKAELPEEIALIETPCTMEQLRSRTSFVLVDCASERLTIWHGAASTEQKRKVAKSAAAEIVERRSAGEFGFEPDCDDWDVVESEEGKETEEFLDAVRGRRGDYLSLIGSKDRDYTARLFYLSSILGGFKAQEVLCAHRSEEFSSPFPFSQAELYSASQPALFLIDNHHELWLWQGWWPEREEDAELSDQTGSGKVRWQAERKAAMQTALDYWNKSHASSGGDDGDRSNVPAYLVWAGLEPLEFRNLFPTWNHREDISQLNIKDGRQPDGKLDLKKQLALLSRTTYSLAEILKRPLPEGVDPTHLEIYLSPEDFQELLAMTKEEFHKLPAWKQTAVKKEKGLF